MNVEMGSNIYRKNICLIATKGLCVSEKWPVRSWKNEKAFFSKGLFVYKKWAMCFCEMCVHLSDSCDIFARGL